MHTRFRLAAALWVALAACGCSGAPGGPKTTLVFTGLTGEPDSLNPLVSNEADVFNLSHLYISDLVDSDGRGELYGELATRVPSRENGDVSADGRTIVYHLRRGVRWQDGVPLTARDVVFSYRAVMNPANNVDTRVGYAEVASIAAPDPATVVVHLRRPFSPFIAYFGAPEGFGIFPEHLLGRYPNLNDVPYDQKPIGSGPYRVVEWKRGDSVVFEANPGYWRGKPHIARLIYRIVPDPNARVQVLRTGEVDAIFEADPQQLPQLRSMPGIRVVLTPVNDIHALVFNTADPVVGDRRVRQAVAYAIDRQKLLAVATYGSGIIVDADQPVNGSAYAPSPAGYRYDPAAARKLLDEAGWRGAPGATRSKNGRPLDLDFAIAPQGITGSTLVATVAQRYLNDVGIATRIKPYSPAVMWAVKAAGGIMASGRYQLAYYAWWVLGPDPDDSWQVACDQIPPAGQNLYFWCNHRADAATNDALATWDGPARKRDYAVVAQEIVADVPFFPLWQIRNPSAYRGTLHNFEPSPFGSVFWNAWSWSF